MMTNKPNILSDEDLELVQGGDFQNAQYPQKSDLQWQAAGGSGQNRMPDDLTRA